MVSWYSACHANTEAEFQSPARKHQAGGVVPHNPNTGDGDGIPRARWLARFAELVSSGFK